MAKPQITLRQALGEPLSYEQLDTNFENLRDATITIAADGTVIVLDLNDTVTLTPGNNVSFAVTGNEITINSEGGSLNSLEGVTPDANGNIDLIAGTNIALSTAANSITITSTSLDQVIEDTAPQLGGELDTNGNAIGNAQGDVEITDNVVFTSNGIIRISEQPGSNRIESISSFLIGIVSTFGGSVSGPSISFDNDSVPYNSTSIGAGTSPDDKITLQDVVRLLGTTTSNRDSITTPQDGMLIYNSTTNTFQGRAGGFWVDLH